MFGGVQLFQIIINLVRGKFVALLLGPEGMGIASLFTTSSATIQKFASLGLNNSIVKEVAADSDNREKTLENIGIALRLVSATALTGALVCMLFAWPLSRLTFGTYEMAWQFMLLGVAVGLTIACGGPFAILQGLHEVKRLSRSSVVGGLSGLLFGVPLYYFFGTRGIVPAMVILSLTMFLFYHISLRNALGHPLPKIRFAWQSHRPMVVKLVSLGLILMANDLILSLVMYAVNLFIRIHGSVGDVGLYQAANTVTNQYSGLVFAAMAMDYFPRLSKAVADNRLMATIVNRQTELVALIIAPAVGALIATAPVIIRLLLSSEFEGILPLMRWMGLGVMLKALAFPMGYISIAKGNKKLFFWMEGIGANVMTLSLSCLGYHFFGLIGLGYALVADNAICIAMYYAVNRTLYGYRFSRASGRHMLAAASIGAACFAASLISEPFLAYPLMGALTIGAATLAWVAIKKKIRDERTDQ